MPKNSDIVHEQLLRKIEDSFLTAVNAAKIPQLLHDELIDILKFVMEENHYE